MCKPHHLASGQLLFVLVDANKFLFIETPTLIRIIFKAIIQLNQLKNIQNLYSDMINQKEINNKTNPIKTFKIIKNYG